MLANIFWLMHILDMETFYDHKSSVHSSGRLSLLNCSMYAQRRLQNPAGCGIYIYQHTTWKKDDIFLKKYLFYDMEVSITIYGCDKMK